MNELQIVSSNGVDVVDSREVARLVGRNHKELMRDIHKYAEILGKSTERNFALSDFFIESSYKDSTGRTLPCYLITKKGCDMVANKMTGEKGVLFTAAYVTAFEKMQNAILSQRYALPKDYPSALRALADKAEEIAALAEKIEADAPAVRFADAITGAETNILVRDLAKLLSQNGFKIGGNRLYELLRNDGYLIKQGSDRNMPMQYSMERGLFFVKETPRMTREKTVIDRVVRVTPKGQQYFINRYAHKALTQ